MPSVFGASMLALAVASGPVSSPVELHVDVTALAAMPPRQLQRMTREASDIWKLQGVALIWKTALVERVLSPTRQVLTVVDAPRASRAAAPSRLGSVLFLEGSVTPELTLVLSLESIGRLVEETPWANRRVRDWPPAVRSELLGRALGRVLAHEIGHYLLAWRTHTGDGLMRQSFRGDLLIDPDRRSFDVPAMLAARLRARLARLAEPGRTLAEIW